MVNIIIVSSCVCHSRNLAACVRKWMSEWERPLYVCIARLRVCVCVCARSKNTNWVKQKCRYSLFVRVALRRKVYAESAVCVRRHTYTLDA